MSRRPRLASEVSAVRKTSVRSVTVRVPATSANLGPGFDTLGLAYSLYNTFTFECAERYEVLGCDERFRGDDNLALVAYRAACERAGIVPVPVRLTIEADVPVSRGLGSSATLLVGGVVGAKALLSLPLETADLLELVNRMEGHPDNVAPALLGGLTAAMQRDGRPYVARLPLHSSYRFCAFIPDFETSTKEARAALPATVSHADAVFNVTRVATLIPALANGDTALLRAALDDRLHQPYRRALIHEFDDVHAAALAAGAEAFFIGGSGSTLIAIYTVDGFVERVREPIARLSHHWRVLPLSPDTEGAKCL